MTNNSSSKHKNKILLAIDRHTMSLNSLEFAFFVAAAFNAEIKGLFVEDLDLIRLAQLPFMQEISSGFAKRPLTNYRMERDLREFAQKMHQRIADAARQLHLPWSFEVIRGNFLSEYDALSHDVNLVLYGSIERSNVNALPTVVRKINLTSNIGQLKGPVVTFCHDLESSRHVFTKAAQLANISDADLFVIVQSTEYPEFESYAKQIIQDIHKRVFFVKTTKLNLDLVYKLTKQVNAGIIVMDKKSPAIKTGDKRDFLKQKGCLFLLVGE